MILSMLDTATVYTIHNLAYQGIFGYRILEVAGVAANGFLYPQITELANVVDIMGRGILFADAITTVSERYAQEILTPTFGEKLDHLLRSRRERLFGILNGLDYEEMNPATDRYIQANFDAQTLDKRAENKRALQEQAHLPVGPDMPLLAMISRLTDQKGFDMLAQIIQPLLAQGVQFVVLGIGDQHYHECFKILPLVIPNRLRFFSLSILKSRSASTLAAICSSCPRVLSHAAWGSSLPCVMAASLLCGCRRPGGYRTRI